MNANELKTELAYFTGTEAYHRFNPLSPSVVLTDGALFLAENAGAFWLMDAIASHVPSISKGEGFSVVRYVGTPDGPGRLTLADDNPANVIYAAQDLEYSDFPLEEITLYVIASDGLWVILLPSEY